MTVTTSPTEAYAMVARAMLTCWFGADGPLRASHVFHAEAASPAQGGSAEIVIHERDLAQGDYRGPRALRVAFVSMAGGANISVTVIKAPPGLASLMLRDVENWARGGSDCQMRALLGQDAAAQPQHVRSAIHR
jgi:hypothetical protein